MCFHLHSLLQWMSDFNCYTIHSCFYIDATECVFAASYHIKVSTEMADNQRRSMDAKITALLRNHLDSSPQFFKSLDEDDFSSNLRILKEDLGNAQEAFNEKKTITIVDPNGQYNVSIRTSPEAVILEKGWTEFSLAHHLHNTDKLVFICGCHNLLIVLIYDEQGKLRGNQFGSSNTGEASSDSSDSDTETRREVTYVSHRRAVTDVEVETALRRATNFRSSGPSFPIQMKRNNVYRKFYVYVPTKFARENLPKKATKLSLRVPSKTEKWGVSCTFKVQSKRQHIWTIMGGWRQFALDNNLEANDALVFEVKSAPTQQRNCRTNMDVHIFRVVSEITPLQVL